MPHLAVVENESDGLKLIEILQNGTQACGPDASIKLFCRAGIFAAKNDEGGMWG